MDRDKVIKGLECCLRGSDWEKMCDECPYEATEEEKRQADWDCHLDQLRQDALTLLKEQTPVKPVKSKLSWEHGYNWDIWDCGYCGSQLRSDANYCDRCGHKVNWDDMEENDA